MPDGKEAIDVTESRLVELMQREGAFSKRMQFVVKDVVETRAAGWQRKTFQSSAKTKNDVRLEQNRDLELKRRGQVVAYCEHVVAGRSPKCLAEASQASRFGRRR
mmetsp:Transcript_57921/g.125921  ORF Transcript_57921/g.125921 Transcript_57921/m.125921 type:complete len:105 (-) Transcript_57921:488-802(-)